ncbi:MAG: radical SAM protein [Desulfovermiculus sp.]
MLDFMPVFQPDLDWIQVGITTQCNAQCVYCPRSHYRDKWVSRHMDPNLFSRFISGLKKVDLLFLQGWGEPFLHPHFWDMLTLVKQKGFLAGCTSNANVLDAENLKRTVDMGLDVLALSLAGKEDTNDRLRPGTSFRQVAEAIETLQRIKAQRNSATPSLHLAYMLLRQDLNGLEKLPDFFLDLGLDHVVLSSLTLPLSPDLEREALLADSPEEYRDLQSKMSAIFARSDLQDKVFFHLYNPFQASGNCAENVQRALCLSVDGVVTPCMFTQVPVQQPASYWYQGRECRLQQADFGHVQDQALKRIWYSREYKKFRKELNMEMCFRCTKTKIDRTLQGWSEK